MSNKYKKRKPTTIPPEKQVERECLKCDESFTAEGKFIRICPRCTPTNNYIEETHTPEAILYGGEGLPNAERYLLRGLK